jgi:hypothetical protein
LSTTSRLLTSADTVIDFDEYHTSLGDMTASDIIKVSSNFSTINLVKEGFDQSSDIYKETMVLLTYLSSFNHVTNFVADPCISFTDIEVKSRDDEPTLWVFGCSHSYGYVLNKSTEKNFGRILSESTNLPLRLVAKGGSSINWSLRHIVEADIRPSDLVVWQITTPCRISCYDGDIVKEVILPNTKNRHLLEVFDDNQQFFNQINFLNFGVQYLRRIGVKFAITSIWQEGSLMYDYLNEYSKYSEYCYAPNCHIDLGFDKLHVGPLSHRAIAQRILDHVQSLYGLDQRQFS